MLCLFEKNFESKGRKRERKTKRKMESIKIMTYEENIN